jgi:predicted site-specific integrase-resolvase
MNGLIESADAFELLHTDEFAQRLKVGRTTIFKWKKEGTLVPGRHFIKKGKIVRYVWARDLIMEIHENLKNMSQTVKKDYVGSKTQKSKHKKHSVINLQY